MTPRARRVLTRVFLIQLNIPANIKTIRIYSRKWWFNKRTGFDIASGRLSAEGFELLSNQFEFEHWPVPIPEKFENHPALMLFLEKHLKHPYYIEPLKLYSFNAPEAFRMFTFVDDVKRKGVDRAIAKFLEREAYLADVRARHEASKKKYEARLKAEALQLSQT